MPCQSLCHYDDDVVMGSRMPLVANCVNGTAYDVFRSLLLNTYPRWAG